VQCSAELSVNLLSTAVFLSHSPLFFLGGEGRSRKDIVEILSVNLTSLSCFSSPHYAGIIIFNYALQPFKAYCAILVRRSNFRHQASPRVSPRESTQRRKVELWARNVREFCLNADFHVKFRDLLHAVEL
jgi:hypothetical protein